MKTELLTELSSTKGALLNTLGRFSGDNINMVPFEGSWTGGQVAEHVYLSASGILRALNGPAKPTERNPEQYVKPLADAFLNFDIKMQSPDFIIPSNQPKNRELLIKMLEETFDGIINATETTELTATCTDFEMPVLGALTRIEFIHFTVVHTKRHIHQLEKILNHLKTE
jgi:hypothetical protein